MMIEPLAEKPVRQSLTEWLEETSEATVANPRLASEWIRLDGRTALQVKNQGDGSAETLNIYVTNGSKTFAIRISNAHSELYKKMLFTFRFT
jgi:hypothetical protein